MSELLGKKSALLLLALSPWALPLFPQAIATVALLSVYVIFPKVARSALLVSLWCSLPFAVVIGTLHLTHLLKHGSPSFKACASPWNTSSRRAAIPIPLYKKNFSTNCVKNRYRYQLSTDSLGRRSNGIPVSGKEHALVLSLGGSTVFGAGVNDNETFSARIAAASKGTLRVVNLGIRGGGFQQALYSFEHIHQLVPEIDRFKKAFLVFTNHYHYIRRFNLGGRWRFKYFGKPTFYPIYKSVNNSVVYAGDQRATFMHNFLDYKLGTMLYINLIASYVKRNTSDYEEHYLKKREIQLFAAGVNKLAAEFYQIHPDGVFMLNNWPLFELHAGGKQNGLTYLKQLYALLDQRIKVVEFPQIDRFPELGTKYSRNLHPGKLAHKKMGGFLYRVISSTAREHWR